MSNTTDGLATAVETGLTTGDLDTARAYAAAGRSEETKRAYRREWQSFERWGAVKGLSVLPTTPESLALYISSLATAGRAAAGIDLALAAISAAHAAMGHDGKALRGSAAVRAVRAGIRRTHGTAQRQVAPATADVVLRMVAGGEGLAGLRDRALLLVGFAGAFRRSELVALTVADVAFSDRGLEVTIRRGKTDQEGRGRVVAIPCGSKVESCPVRALRAWLDAAGGAGGVLFRSVDRWGRVGAGLTGQDVARLVKRRAKAVGLDPSQFSGHSLRAGLATSAAMAGRSDRSIMAQTGHKSRAMVDRYVRAADRWTNNAAGGLL